MPLPVGTKFRFRKLKDGRKQRLAIDKDGNVIEVVTFGKGGKKSSSKRLRPKR